VHPVVLIIPKAHRFNKSDVALIALEIDIMYWLAENLDEEGVGGKIFRSKSCVNKHIGILYTKTGHCTHAGLMAFAFLYGVLFFKENVLLKWEKKEQPEKKNQQC
jgi:DNA-binding CsgD family transcriptional regulator